ncbi:MULTISPECIES: DUF2243 domain-containing protein [unclassified Methylophilus]|jgi:uncharacterized membrane protein|uniref:DUF2243 domain-containing protein n=1 Tax=unclassified Methylophilus TaxID=2630143 RepID=UPI00070017E5|nr:MULTISPECIES: DUF2243 domain-containing protein [unclassified Methylophilus]KQT42479.1 hypothetical protein ASG34_06970 [Methylophilus sp. Leaf416]KQT56662.1 hypothetical protein ASG44_06945 [Methylophilus sp. Leaf459]
MSKVNGSTHGQRKAPLISAGMLLGIGLGGFIDGIVFHQILQIHSMLSNKIPVTDLVSAKINMTWDGYFHAAVWIMTLVGVHLLFKAGKRNDVRWSGKVLSGSMLAGWGAFNITEGIIDHQILNIHHVMEYVGDKLPYDLAFLASGISLILIGLILIKD